jgi:hypothetical protein
VKIPTCKRNFSETNFLSPDLIAMSQKGLQQAWNFNLKLCLNTVQVSKVDVSTKQQ